MKWEQFKLAVKANLLFFVLGFRILPCVALGAPPPVASTWPQTFASDRGSALVYQPQVISWPEHTTLNTRMVVSITPRGLKTPVLGTIEVAFATRADFDTRSVTLSDPKLLSTRFPSLDTARAARFEEGIRAALNNMGPKRIPLDTVLLSLRQQAEKPPAVALKNDPPVIFHSDRPASLVVFDGEPVLAPIGGTSLSSAVNTNWDVFFNQDDRTWYLLDNGAWLATPDYKGPWGASPKLPAAFYRLPKDANFKRVRAQIPGRSMPKKNVPIIYVSTVPAEIIVTMGPPVWEQIPGSGLMYVSNTTSDLFREPDGTLYYLVSGRWFSAPGLDGPWSFATETLPPDFSLISSNGPKASVLVSVPGTSQSQDALLQAQIPQQGTLSRSSAKIQVVYAGEPKFEPVKGTDMFYSVNTSFDVIRVGSTYYSCWRGAWFQSPSPTGPWILADTVPPVIYTIPSSSPLYPVTYVRVYSVTPTTVTYGYTAGYTMGFVSSGVIVYGTGWYYPPYVYPAPVPVYYGYPVSYTGAVYYNSTTGAWARGGTVYGPYGGAVSAGTAYNPNTGAWAHGAAVYGPNGGAGAWSAYNPSTGSYAHGSASWGPDGGTANASWYNARTGVSGSTNQNYNQYSRWGSSQISGPNQTINTRSESNAQGSAGGFHSTSGAEGGGVHGTGGNNAGVVKGPGGNVYAGADGNVYRHTSDGWSKYDDGSWNSVTKPSGANQPSSLGESERRSQNTNPGEQNNRLGQSAGGFRNEFENSSWGRQLDQDRFARTEGEQRQQRFNQWRGFEGRGGGGGFGGGSGGGFGGFRGRR